MSLSKPDEITTRLHARIDELENKVNELRQSRRVLLNLLDYEKKENIKLNNMINNLNKNKSI